jgi:SNF2 family DNA or RNA helicase
MADFTYFEYQKKTIGSLYSYYLKQEKGILLSMQTGMGKTIVVLGFLSKIIETENINLVFLIIVPKSIKFQWKNEVAEKFPNIITTLLHYEQVIGSDLLDKVQQISKDGKKVFLVMDECHNMKNETTKLYKTISEISIQCGFSIFMTATPFLNEPKDVTNILNLTGNKMISLKWDDVKEEVVLPKLDIKLIDIELEGYHQVVYSEIAKKSLNTLIDISLLQRISNHPFFILNQENIESQVLPFLQNETTTKTKKSRKKLYYFDSETPKLEITTDMVCNLVRQKIPTLNIEIDHFNFEKSNKFEKALDIVKEFSSKTIVTVFSRYAQTLKLFSIFLDKHGISNNQLDGKVTRKRKRSINYYMNKFQNTPLEKLKKKVLLTTQGICGTGLNMTFSSCMIIFEKNWNSSLDEQTIARIYRLGQKNDCNVFILISQTESELLIKTSSDLKDEIKDHVLGL